MACQASARVARGWNSSIDWLHKGRTLMAGRKYFCSLLKTYVFYFFQKCMCFISAVRHLGAKVGTWGTNNTLSSAPSAELCDKRHIRGCLWGGSAVARPSSFCSKEDFWSAGSKAILAKVLGFPLREEVASCWALAPSILLTPQGWLSLVWLSAKSAQVWGDSKQQKSWCVSVGSVAMLETTSESLWSIPQSPPQLFQTGCQTKPERRGRELCPPLTSSPAWDRGGALTLTGWTTNA